MFFGVIPRPFFSRKGSVKGQMFFIAAIFMVMGFFLLVSLLSLPEISQEGIFQQTSSIDRSLKNIANEYGNIAGAVSTHPIANRSTEYFYNFSGYIRGEFNSKILYVYVFSNGSSQRFSATIGNFLQDGISGNLTFIGASPSTVNFSLSDMANTTFTIAGINATIPVLLNYTIQNRQEKEKFYFTDSTKNYAAAFFDVTLTDSGFFVRSKDVYNRTW